MDWCKRPLKYCVYARNGWEQQRTVIAAVEPAAVKQQLTALMMF